MKDYYNVYKIHIPTDQKYLVRRFDNLVTAFKYCKSLNLRLKAVGDNDLYKYVVIDL